MKTIIKHITVLGLLSAGLFFYSCSDDDEGGSSISLEGTLWIENSITTTGCTDPDDNETDISNCDSNECFTIQLSDGVITSTELEGGSTEVETGTYVISGNTLTVTIGGIILEINFQISGNTLTISFVDPFDGCTNTVVYTTG